MLQGVVMAPRSVESTALLSSGLRAHSFGTIYVCGREVFVGKNFNSMVAYKGVHFGRHPGPPLLGHVSQE